MLKDKRRGRYGVLLIAVFCGALLFHAACGDGNESGDSTPTPGVSDFPPIAVITYSPSTPVLGQALTLDGSSSFDPDGGTIASYAWSQTEGEAVALSSETAASTTFTVPSQPTTLTFELVVVDDEGQSSSPASIEIEVRSVVPVNPVVSAIFVSAAHGSDDPARSGSYLQPVETIDRGIELAKAKSLSDVYVLEGTYQEEVVLEDGINLIGCAEDVDASGNLIMNASGVNKTIIKALVTEDQAIRIKDVKDVSLQCLSVEGAVQPDTSRGILIENAQYVEVHSVKVSTPGQAGGFCRDVEIVGSLDVTLQENTFTSGGACEDYIGVLVDGSIGVDIVPDQKGNAFVFASGGGERYLKGVQVAGGDEVEIVGNTFEDDGLGFVASDAILTAIVLTDTTNAQVVGNAVAVQGAEQSIGMSLRCETKAFDVSARQNTIELQDATDAITGIKVDCPQAGSSFMIAQNLIDLLPHSNSGVELRGVDVTTLLRPVNLDLINNIFIMDVVVTDIADKTGLALTKLGSASTIHAYHNTMLITGNQGALYGFSSDRSDVQFAAINNILLIYGSNSENAVFALPKACDTNNCIAEMVSNLINENFFNKDVKLAYDPATTFSVDLDVANECDLLVPPTRCTNGDVDRSGNSLMNGLTPVYFDLGVGELLSNYQYLVKDEAEVGTGVTDDVDGNARDDGHPDIGATEY